MYVFVTPVQPHATFNCVYCAQIVVVEEADRYLLDKDEAELICPGCGGVNQSSSAYLKNQLERDRELNGFYQGSSFKTG